MGHPVVHHCFSFPPCHRFAESSAFRSPFFHFHFAGIHRDEHITFQPLCAMCMFLVCVNPAAASDEFALVVVSIRDEYFTRPTRLVSFWKEDPRIIGGMDLESGREGGTWLAMNNGGQIAALLNVLRPTSKVAHGKRNRGFLVPQFLQSTSNGAHFLESLSLQSRDYADFLMVSLDFDIETKGTTLSYYANLESSGNPVTITPPGMRSFTFGNNQPQSPWIKTIVAQKMFEGITRRNIKTRRKKKLVSELMEMMNDETTYFPDGQLLKDGDGYDRSFLQALSSVRVRIPFVGFGTRTQSVITIDATGKVTFVERTIQSLDPDSGTECNKWPMRMFRFVVNDASQRLPLYSLSRL